MRTGSVAVMLVIVFWTFWATAACGGGSGGGLFKQYEYEEEMYLSLDGSATIYVNSSVPALDALRGTAFDPSPNARIDLAQVRDYFTSPVTRVTRVRTSRRSNRRFVHVRLEVDDVRRLAEAPPFAWSSYDFGRDGDLVLYRQIVGARATHGARNAVETARLTGQELVAFRVHVPSQVDYHNAGPENLKRGNILVWEQTLAERLRGAPLTLDARMESQSILYRTLWLFGATFVAVGVMFGAVIWFIFRRGRTATTGVGPAGLREHENTKP